MRKRSGMRGRSVTVREAWQRPVLAGSTIGGLACIGVNKGAPVGAAPDSVFAPDVALPAQVMVARSRTELDPCRALWLAVLTEAVETATRHLASDGDAVRAEARRWLADAARHATSFEWVCEVLGLSADAIRRAVFTPGFAMDSVRRMRAASDRTRVVSVGA